VSKPLAKIAPEVSQNQQDDFFSLKWLVLCSTYSIVFETLWRMEHGAGLRPEVARILGEPSPQLDQASWLAAILADQRDLEEFAPRNLVEEDWAIRTRIEIARDLASVSEPGMLARLIRANAPRTVRKIANQSKWLRGTVLWLFLIERPEQFLAITASPRFPSSSDKQISFLARGVGAVLARYQPSTGARYLAKFELCEQCGERPAVMKLFREGREYSWCGTC
jgi:hypothetical protein